MHITRNCIQTIVILVLLTAVGSAWAQIFEVINEDGTVEFTDRPPTTAKKGRTVEEVEQQQLNTIPGTPLGNTAKDAPAEEPEPEPEVGPPATVIITTPENESTVAMGPGNFTVSATARPSLANNERLVLLIDGEPHGDPQQSATWRIEGAIRGSHDLRVQRLASGGRTVAQSKAVRIYVLRPSIIGR
jgi:hypothetical protein